MEERQRQILVLELELELTTAKAILKQIPKSEVVISSPFPQYDEDFYAPIPVV
jgi:hypothetical protein